MKILITGGGSEIGAAIADRQAAMGNEILVTATSEKSLQQAIDRLKSEGVQAKGFVFRLEDPRASEKELESAAKSGIDGIVLNAFERVPALKRFHEIPWEKSSAYLRSNIEGNAWLVHKLLPSMIDRRMGRIVLISSLTAQVGTSFYGTYCMAKRALEGMILNLATDYGEFGIRSNILRPGIIATERNERFWKRSSYQERIQEIIPAQTIGKPVDIAVAMDPFLAKDCYCNGSALDVTGGLPSMRSKALL